MLTFRERLELIAKVPFDKLPKGEQVGPGMPGPYQSFRGTFVIMSPDVFETLQEAAAKLLMDNPK